MNFGMLGLFTIVGLLLVSGVFLPAEGDGPQDSPEYARRMVDWLTRRSQQIAEFPFSDRSVPEYDVDQIR